MTRAQTSGMQKDLLVDLHEMELDDLSTQRIKDATMHDPDLAVFMQDKRESINRPKWKEISGRSHTYKVLGGS